MSRPLSIVAVLLLATGLLSGEYAEAQLSVGCGLLQNQPPTGNNVFSLGSGTQGVPFLAGETIEFSVMPPAIGTPTKIELKVDTVLVDSASFPGTVRHGFVADGNFVWVAYLDQAGSGATWSTNCIGLPTPVSTLDWQGVTVLITLMAGFAFYGRRRGAVG